MLSDKEIKRFLISIQILSCMINRLSDARYRLQKGIQADDILESISNLNKAFYVDNQEMFLHSKEDIEDMIQSFYDVQTLDENLH